MRSNATKAAAKIDIEKRRVEIAELRTQGWSQSKIAEKYGVSQQAISKQLAVIRRHWLEEQADNHTQWIEEQLQKLDLLEQTLWSEWERSRSQRITRKITRDEDGTKKEETRVNQCGDARYLAEINKCIARRCALLGLDEVPYNREGEEGDHDVPTIDNARSQYDTISAALRKRAGSIGVASSN